MPVGPEGHAILQAGTQVVCVWCGRWGRAGAPWQPLACTAWAPVLPPRAVAMLAGPGGVEIAFGNEIGPRAWLACVARGFVQFRDAG